MKEALMRRRHLALEEEIWKNEECLLGAIKMVPCGVLIGGHVDV